MAILDIQTYYYFKLRGGEEYAIKETKFEINTSIMTMYRELTEAQREFHLANPTASVREVVNCQLSPANEPPAPDVAEYARAKSQELKDACGGAVSVTAMEYAMANASLQKVSHALHYTGDSYYSLSDARAVMKRFMDESAAAMAVYDAHATLILAATSIEEADSAFEAALAELNFEYETGTKETK